MIVIITCTYRTGGKTNTRGVRFARVYVRETIGRRENCTAGRRNRINRVRRVFLSHTPCRQVSPFSRALNAMCKPYRIFISSRYGFTLRAIRLARVAEIPWNSRQPVFNTFDGRVSWRHNVFCMLYLYRLDVDAVRSPERRGINPARFPDLPLNPHCI